MTNWHEVPWPEYSPASARRSSRSNAAKPTTWAELRVQYWPRGPLLLQRAGQFGGFTFVTISQQIGDALANEFRDFQSAGQAATLCFRLILAGLLGGVLGYERESKGKAAGLRTHMLVALGTALFVVVPQFYGMEQDSLARIIQGIIAGIGFLGAGSILKNQAHDEIHGLTTAASVWMTAAIGIAAGLGRATTAILGALLGLTVLSVLSQGVAWLHSSAGRDKEAPAEPEDKPRHSSGD
ncbi:MAG: MgtC/SapB family protein [Pirellulales bacterium]|nr:MgtC/SapB family protein [Pirellulales bacterium]